MGRIAWAEAGNKSRWANDMRRDTRWLLSALIASMMLGTANLYAPTSAIAQQQPAGQTVNFNIPAQSLSSAINAFIRTTGWEVGFNSPAVVGKQSTAVKGVMTPAQALHTLLAGTGLNAQISGPSTAALVAGSSRQDAATAADGSTVLDTIVVEGHQGETVTGHFNGFAATRSATATKTDTPLIETPQSISVVGSDEIKTRRALNLADALSYTSGVTTSEGYQNDSETFYIRGFSSSASTGSIYRDGTKFSVNVYNVPQEPYGLERIEVLKGASSVLYGTSAPGGIINTVTKLPTDEPLRELNVDYGSFNKKQISGDFGGPIDPEGQFSYRLTFLGRNADAFKDFSQNDRAFVSGSVKWQPTDATSLIILGEYQKDKTTPIYGLPAKGTVLPNVNGRFARDLFTGEPGYDQNKQSRWQTGYMLEHDFNEQLKLRSSARYMKAQDDRPAIFLNSLADDERTMSRIANRSIGHSEAFVIDNSLQYEWNLGRTENTSLIGVDYTWQKHQQRVYQAPYTDLDLFEPVYSDREIGVLPATGINNFRKEQVGVYAQNQMKIDDRWVLLLGGRYDWVSYDNMPNELISPTWRSADDSAFTGRAGLVYLFDNGFAPYVSFSQSFEPAIGSDRNGNLFKPTEGEQFEVGLRYQPTGMDVMFTAAAYQLTQTNVSVTDPENINYSTQLGEVRSRGIELEARGQITKDWSIIAAYAYTDARTLKSSPLTPEKAGVRTGNVPYNQLSLWAEYDFTSLGLPGLKAGAGARYVGSMKGVWVNADVPAYTLADAAISYTTADNWRVALNATNLFDKDYVASCTYGCFYGEPLNVSLSVGKKW